jgi:hypothetical protein
MDEGIHDRVRVSRTGSPVAIRCRSGVMSVARASRPGDIATLSDGSKNHGFLDRVLGSPGPSSGRSGVVVLVSLAERVSPHGDERVHRNGRSRGHGPADNGILQYVRQDDRTAEPCDKGKTADHNDQGKRATSNVLHHAPQPGVRDKRSRYCQKTLQDGPVPRARAARVISAEQSASAATAGMHGPRRRECTAWILYSNSANRPIEAHNNQFGEMSRAATAGPRQKH